MTIVALWLPILVSAVVVFFVSAIIWMAMPWHKSDFSKTSDEEGARAALIYGLMTGGAFGWLAG